MTLTTHLIQALLGIILADVVSAFIHWAQDHLGSTDTFLVGSVIESGITHHEDPMLFTRHTIWERSGLPIVGGIVAGLVGVSLFGQQTWIVAAAIAGMLLIEIQVLVHRDDVPTWARCLQYIGVIQHPRQHNAHHESGGAYAVITNWTNPALDASGVWKLLERFKTR